MRQNPGLIEICLPAMQAYASSEYREPVTEAVEFVEWIMQYVFINTNAWTSKRALWKEYNGDKYKRFTTKQLFEMFKAARLSTPPDAEVAEKVKIICHDCGQEFNDRLDTEGHRCTLITTH